MSAELVAVIAVIAVAMLFDYTNGFHDAANAIATSVSTRALTPRAALAIAAVGNFVGAHLGVKVAKTVGEGLVILPTGLASLGVVFAGVVGAVAWNLITWYFGIPSSSSHALFGGLVGATLMTAGGQVQWGNIVSKVIVPMVASPLIGFSLGALVMFGVLWAIKGLAVVAEPRPDKRPAPPGEPKAEPREPLAEPRELLAEPRELLAEPRELLAESPNGASPEAQSPNGASPEAQSPNGASPDGKVTVAATARQLVAATARPLAGPAMAGASPPQAGPSVAGLTVAAAPPRIGPAPTGTGAAKPGPVRAVRQLAARRWHALVGAVRSAPAVLRRAGRRWRRAGQRCGEWSQARLRDVIQPKPLNRFFRHAQTVSATAMAVGHGMQDAAKTMGIVVLALYTGGFQESPSHIPEWVYYSSATVLALGTYSGGWRIIRTLGRRIIHLHSPEGFAAETVASSVLYFNALVLGAPISTTHTITTAIMGVGATKKLSAVRWGVAGNIVTAWLLTFPGAAVIAVVAYALLGGFFR